MYQLDLHGLPHEDVDREVIVFIEKHWDSSQELEIITGNSKIMQNIVKKVLDEYKLVYTVGEYNSPNQGFIRTQM